MRKKKSGVRLCQAEEKYNMLSDFALFTNSRISIRPVLDTVDNPLVLVPLQLTCYCNVFLINLMFLELQGNSWGFAANMFVSRQADSYLKDAAA